MTRDYNIQARWDDEAGVWTATSRDVPGLVVEADTWSRMIEEVRLILPELLEVRGELNAPLHCRVTRQSGWIFHEQKQY